MTNPSLDAFSNQVANIASTYDGDTILILGKGPSADEVDPAVFEGKLVIGLNDAEAIVPVDITIFHAEWVEEAVRKNGLRSSLYVTSTDFTPDGAQVARLPFQPLTQDTSDLMMRRFMDEDHLAIEEVMFLTALEIARLVASQRGRVQTVYMVGFDFDPDLGYASAIEPGLDPEPQEDRTAIIRMQEFFLLNTLYMLTNSNLEVIHVGDRAFSTVTPSALNARLLPQRVSHADEPPREPVVEITAEITTNHFGDRRRLERMVRLAKKAGADHVKVQKRDVDTFYTEEQLRSPYVSPFGDTYADYRYALELDKDDFAFLDELCRELDISWFASVLDQPSLEFMLDVGVSMIKLPSTISEHVDYLAYVAEHYDGPVVLSTGMTDQDYEQWVLDTFGQQERLYLLHCNSAYPTPNHHTNIGVVRHYHELSTEYDNLVPGYSSHDMGWMASALAVAAGARMVEKHVKLGNTEWAHFDAVAVDLTTDAFNEYVAQVRNAQMMVGSSEKQITPSEHHKYRVK